MATIAEYQDAFALVMSSIDPSLNSQPNTVNFKEVAHDYTFIYDGDVTLTIELDGVELTQVVFDALPAPEQVVVEEEMTACLGPFAP